MVGGKAGRGLLRLGINGLLMANEQGQQLWTLQCRGSQSINTASDHVAGKLNDPATERNASIKRGGRSNHPFAHLKRILKVDRLRLRGPNGARDEFVLAATAQNLRKLAKLVPMPQPNPA